MVNRRGAFFVYVDDDAVGGKVLHGDDNAFGAVHHEVAACVVRVFTRGYEFFAGELGKEAEFGFKHDRYVADVDKFSVLFASVNHRRHFQGDGGGVR